MAAEVRHNQQHGNLICATCKRRHCDETGAISGSIGPAPIPFKHVGIINIETRVCILPQVTEFSWLLMRLYQHYKNGHLWAPALGLLEQPNIYLKAMELLDQVYPQSEGK